MIGSKGNDTQSTSSVFDPRTDILFQAQLGKGGVACWNVRKQLNPENFQLVVQDEKRIVYPSHILVK